MSKLNIKHAFIYYSSSTSNIVTPPPSTKSIVPHKYKMPFKRQFHFPKPIFTIREQYKSFVTKNKAANTNNSSFRLKKLKLTNASADVNETLKTFLFRNKNQQHKHKQQLPGICISKQDSRNNALPSVNVTLKRNKTMNNKVGIEFHKSNGFKQIYEMKHFTRAIGNKYLKAVLERDNNNNIKEFLQIKQPEQTPKTIIPLTKSNNCVK